ncbi:MAG: hypothetical protein OEU74_08765 [Gammaproteobacteria bacterium]|nr:hypothetical protein [Gammaproteobacteria bacterium]
MKNLVIACMTFAATTFTAPQLVHAAEQSNIDSLRKEIDELKKQVSANQAPSSSQANFNPAISLILMGTAASFDNDPDDYAIPGVTLAEETDPGKEGFSLAETELIISGNIDDKFFGRFTTALTPENEIEIEEAFVQTLALPAGFGLQFGRFYSEIGYLNNKHTHQWDFVDQPLVYRAYLGNQYNDDGMQLRWLAPTDLFLEFGGEAFSGDSFPASRSSNESIGSYSLFMKLGDDVGISHSWLAGLSYLATQSEDRETEEGDISFSGDDNLIIADLVWKWAPAGNDTRTSLVFQAEYLKSMEQGDYTIVGSGTNPVDRDKNGWYAQLIYKFQPRWRAGLRYDRLSIEDPGSAFSGTSLDTEDHTPQRVSAMVDFSHSEYSRFRLQYNRDESYTVTDNQWYLQYTMSLGAHGAHRY